MERIRACIVKPVVMKRPVTEGVCSMAPSSVLPQHCNTQFIIEELKTAALKQRQSWTLGGVCVCVCVSEGYEITDGETDMHTLANEYNRRVNYSNMTQIPLK